MPDAVLTTLNELQELAGQQGEALTLAPRTLWARMRDRGLLASRDAARQRNSPLNVRPFFSFFFRKEGMMMRNDLTEPRSGVGDRVAEPETRNPIPPAALTAPSADRAPASPAGKPAGKRKSLSTVEPLTVRGPELAQLLRISLATLWRWDADGRLGPRGIRIGGCRLWPVAEVRRWIEAGMPDRVSWLALNQLNGQGHEGSRPGRRH